MSLPISKNPLIIRWTDDISVRSSDTGLTSYAVGKIFSGASLPQNRNLDTVLDVGIFRILHPTVQQNNIPPIDDITGFIQVMDINRDEETNSSYTNVRRIRQIIYPDNENELSPYTRVGTSDSVSGIITWSEWEMMGGAGALKRVVVNGIDSAKIYGPNTDPKIRKNVMYESFGSESSITDITKRNKFTLPSASSVPVGTRIGIEQYTGMAHIYLDGDSSIDQVISASSSYSLTSDATFQSNKTYYIFSNGDFVQATDVSGSVPPKTYYEKSIEPTSYVFECVLPKSGNVREWVLDVEHNHGAVLTEMNKRVSDITEDFEAMNKNLSGHTDQLSDLQEAYHARPMKYIVSIEPTLQLEYSGPSTTKTQLTSNNIKNYIGRSYNMSSTDDGLYTRTYITREHVGNWIQTSNDANASSESKNLYYNDVHIVCGKDNNGRIITRTISFPATLSTGGVKVIIELPYDPNPVTIKTMNGTTEVDSETFTPNGEAGIDPSQGQYLTLHFEYLSAKWRLLSLA